MCSDGARIVKVDSEKIAKLYKDVPVEQVERLHEFGATYPSIHGGHRPRGQGLQGSRRAGNRRDGHRRVGRDPERCGAPQVAGDLDTRFRKIVVTDDDGRFLLPDLPAATYDVWVRGYGLADSTPVSAPPGQTLTLTVRAASTPQEAAQVYPANYWYSLLEVPGNREFPGTGAEGNGIAASLQHQGAWVDLTKQGCQLCHQMGNRFTFDISHLDRFDSSTAAWDHRVTVGQRGSQMSRALDRFGRARVLDTRCSRPGPTGSRRETFRLSRRVRRASSATWC